MKRLLSIFFLPVLFGVPASAQSGDGLRTVDIDSVRVTGKSMDRAEGVSAGVRTSVISGEALQVNRSRSLAELLGGNSTVYIKSLGRGAASTASFRGTAPSHTKVTWNGITLNPSMSSTFDFSQVPVFFMDDVTLYHGGADLRHGTGAIGGSVDIANRPDWTDTTHLRAMLEYGSFQTYTGAVNLRFMGQKSLFKTGVYHQQSDNDYRYLNKIFRLEPFEERRKDAQYNQSGLMQEAYFRTGDHSMLSSGLWLMYGRRYIPKVIISNITRHDIDNDYSLKFYTGYDHAEGRHEFSLKAAYLLDVLDYEIKHIGETWQPQDGSFNRMQGVQLKGDYRYRRSEKLSFGASVRYARDFIYAAGDTIRPSLDPDDNYRPVVRAGRNVADLGADIEWKPWKRLQLSAQAVGEANDGDLAPAFSTGVLYDIFPQHLTIKGSASYNHKFPSLNDIYWIPGGNPDLLPEKGFTYDATLTFMSKIGRALYFRSEATVYLMNVDNWIMWLPRDGYHESGAYVWSPVNINDVLSCGTELMAEVNLLLRDLRMKFRANYAYTRSENRNSNFELDGTRHMQLPYVPLHQANGLLSAEWKNIFLNWQVSYTGKRYITRDESYETPGYCIHDIEIGYNRVAKGGFAVTPGIVINNVFDEYYESTRYYPMPLRSISGSLTVSF